MILKFPEEEMNKYVREYLAGKSGIRDREKLSRFEKTAGRYRKTAMKGLDPRASVTEINRFRFDDGRLVIDGEDYGDFRIRPSDAGLILKVYSYVLSAGNFETDIDPVTDAFVDLWGNAYCDTAHRILRDRLFEMSDGKPVSPPFGPGFFNMGIEKLPRIMELAGAEAVGVRLFGTYMLPLKSCAGFFFVSEEPLELPEKNCASCTGSRLNCNYCRVRSRDENCYHNA